MPLTTQRTIIVILVAAAATFLTRVIPFAIFGRKKEVPKFVKYLGDVLPVAILGALVVYCCKDFTNGDINVIIPTLISIAVTAIIHLIKHNTLLSIASGTICYMLLIHFVFV